KLDDFVSAGGGARNAAGVHGNFRAARAEAHHFDGIAGADFFRQLPFLIVRHAESRALVELFFNSLHDGGMAMARHKSAEAKVVVNVFVAVYIADFAALAILNKNRIRLVMAIVAGHS